MSREVERLLDAARRLLPSSLTMAEHAHIPDGAKVDVTTCWGALRGLARAVREVDALDHFGDATNMIRPHHSADTGKMVHQCPATSTATPSEGS